MADLKAVFYNGKRYRCRIPFDAAGHGDDPDLHFEPGDEINSCQCHMEPRIAAGLVEEIPVDAPKPKKQGAVIDAANPSPLAPVIEERE